jgi:putative flavoprotein involved in K+ transport
VLASEVERVDTVVVGGGAAGLAAGWHLRRRGSRFVILDAEQRIGDSWQRRYDALRLFTPARFCALPGLPLPLPHSDHPNKDDIADYLAAYAASFALPVRPRAVVHAHRVVDGRHRLKVGDLTVDADHLIVATGALRRRVVPAFASGLHPAVRQLHSSSYRRPSDLRPGPALVVGAGTAGADIALDLARDREVLLAGRRTGHVPIGLVRSAGFRRLLYERRVPSGRAGDFVRARFNGRAGPLIWQTESTLRAAGIRRTARVAGVRQDRPVLADGEVVDVPNVIWCTGLRPDHRWLDPRALGRHGWPVHRFGISGTLPGLAFVGLPLQRAFGSGFLGGMSGDAAYVVDRLKATT